MTTSPVPQPLVALTEANRVRVERARLKRDVKAGRVTITEALAADCALSMRVLDLLRAQRFYGPVRCRKLLRRAGVPEHARVAGLTDRQRAALIELTDVAGRVA